MIMKKEMNGCAANVQKQGSEGFGTEILAGVLHQKSSRMKQILDHRLRQMSIPSNKEGNKIASA